MTKQHIERSTHDRTSKRAGVGTGPAGRRIPLATAISAILASGPVAHAAETQPSDSLEEITVTAQKKTENLQDVPISIEALGQERLDELHVADLDDYVKYLPGVTTVKGLGQGGNGIGTTHVYMRGVVSGQDGNHSASQPSVGTYFDEMPVTTIDGTIDIHVYDIERVEVLEGPQGTLYGASSEAGTIRIITNKPDPTRFSAGYDVGGNSVDHGGLGSVYEGFVNLPLTSTAAIRLVGWDEHDSGDISNVAGTDAAAGIVAGTRTWYNDTSAPSLNNAGSVSAHYNTVETKGGRATLQLKIADNWTITPMFMGQSIDSTGFFGYDPAVGDLELVHFGPENYHDAFTQAALTVAGKASDLDIVYSGGYLKRNTHTVADYSDYSYFYDKWYGSGSFWNAGSSKPIEPQEFDITDGDYEKWSNELRVSTPLEYPLKATLGAFDQRQLHNIWEQYVIPGAGGSVYGNNPNGFAAAYSIPGLDNTIWLTDEQRVDRDSALFGQLVWDIDSSWQLTGGLRFFKAKNSLQGFYGYSAAYDNLTGYFPGQNACGPPGTSGEINYAPFRGAPCTNLNDTIEESGHTQRVSLSYKFDKDRMVYATYSTGFRPGGVNRVYDAQIKAIFPPYQADYLKNYEIGWKTEWLNRKLRWNGAIFLENWDNFQFSYLGPNSVTVVQNAASAQIKGIETNLEWVPGGGWTFDASATYIDAKLTSNFCGTYLPGTAQLVTNCPDQINGGPNNDGLYFADGTVTKGPLAPSGTHLPVVPAFKGNAVARYSFPLDGMDASVQLGYVHQSSSTPLLFPVFQQKLGDLPAYNLFDFSANLQEGHSLLQFYVTNIFDERAELTRFAACTPTTCNQSYIIPTQPRTIAVKFGQKF